MSVRKRQWITSKGEPREAWVIDYTDRQGDRHIETFARKKDADTRYAEVNVDVRAGVHIAASKSITVEEAAEIWIEVSQLDGLERATIQQYRGHIDNHIVPALGRVKLSDLTVAGVEAFATDLRKAGASKAMVRKITASLGSLIAVAHKRGLASRNVVRDIGRKRTKGETRHKQKLRSGLIYRRSRRSPPSWLMPRIVGGHSCLLRPSPGFVPRNFVGCAGEMSISRPISCTSGNGLTAST